VVKSDQKIENDFVLSKVGNRPPRGAGEEEKGRKRGRKEGNDFSEEELLRSRGKAATTMSTWCPRRTPNLVALDVGGGGYVGWVHRQFVAGGKFFAENGKAVGRFDANANDPRRNANHRDGDFVPNQDLLPGFSR